MTEAMLLKSKSNQLKARNLFNSTLKKLNENMDELSSTEEEKKSNNAKCKTFDDFCTLTTRLESAYNELHKNAEELKLDIENTLFLVSKNQSIDVNKTINHVLAKLPTTVHVDIVVIDDRVNGDVAVLKQELHSAKKGNVHTLSDEAVASLQDLDGVLEHALHRKKPNYFTLGFYMMRNPDANVDDMDIDELTAMTRKYLDDEFMLDFIDIGAKALLHSRNKSLEAKKQLLEKTDKALEFFHAEKFDKKEANELANELQKAVEEAIDRLQVIKNSVEYTFGSSLKAALKKYFDGVVKNAT